eukprot:8254520-Karenia_brevis.AAC.1
MWQCGYRGVRVGEASHPGPGFEDEELSDPESDGAAISPFKIARLSALGGDIGGEDQVVRRTPQCHGAALGSGHVSTQLDTASLPGISTLGNIFRCDDGHGEVESLRHHGHVADHVGFVPGTADPNYPIGAGPTAVDSTSEDAFGHFGASAAGHCSASVHADTVMQDDCETAGA